MSLKEGSLDIAVVGGSLAGLFAAIPLLRMPQNHNVTILERSGTPLLHDQGAGIVAGPNVQRWLEKFESFGFTTGVESKDRLYLSANGDIVEQETLSQWMTSWDLLYHLGRANFDGQKSKHLTSCWDGITSAPKGQHLKESWSRAKYAYGRSVQDLKVVGEKVAMTWRDTMEDSETKGQTYTMLVDYVVCADGPSSNMRSLLLGYTTPRRYAGYVAFRGTVPETELSPAALTVFDGHFAFFHMEGTQILAYTIPGVNGSVQKGSRLVNWVWYWNFEQASQDLEEVLTDSSGNKHRYTLPTGGKLRKNVWQRQTQRADQLLPPQFAEVVNKTTMPFVQTITDMEPPVKEICVGRLLDGKATLLGDALAGFRPHTAASTSQAAFDALLLEKTLSGEIEWAQYEEDVLHYATNWQKRGVILGQASQFGNPDANGTNPLRSMARDIVM